MFPVSFQGAVVGWSPVCFDFLGRTYRLPYRSPFCIVLASIFLGAPTLLALQQHTTLAPAGTAPSSTAVPMQAHITTLGAGLPLRVQLDRRYRLRVGQPVEGHLIDPVYSVDHIVLPANTPVYGTITALKPAPRSTRAWARLNGDFTPLKQPVLRFGSLQLPDGTRLQISATATERTTKMVEMNSTAKKRPSRVERAKKAIHAKIGAAKKEIASIFHPHGQSDHAIQALYGQLPYHPQNIWPGAQYDADLTQPVTLPDPQANHLLPLTPPAGHLPPGTIEARLTTGISSATSKVGTPVKAVLTRPYLAPDRKHVILPEGTLLLGTVTQAKSARVLGRNGTLRFTFRQIKLSSGALERVHAQMAAVEGQKGQNITVDSEGGAHANADQGKYIAPLMLGALAGDTTLDPPSGQGTALGASNGFGLVARLLSVVYLNPVAIQGFAYYALGQSVTKRWLVRGHNVVFPRDTRMKLDLSDR
jgi:hypothetical protein